MIQWIPAYAGMTKEIIDLTPKTKNPTPEIKQQYSHHAFQ
jgi:hypothetical protein